MQFDGMMAREQRHSSADRRNHEAYSICALGAHTIAVLYFIS